MHDSVKPVRWVYSGCAGQNGYEHRREGSFVLVSTGSHPNSPKHWVPASGVSTR